MTNEFSQQILDEWCDKRISEAIRKYGLPPDAFPAVKEIALELIGQLDACMVHLEKGQAAMHERNRVLENRVRMYELLAGLGAEA